MNARLARLLLLPLGTLALTALFMVAHAVTTAEPYDPFGTSRFPWTVGFVAAFLVCAYAVGLPELPKSRSGAVGAGAVAVLGSIVLLSLAQLSLGSPLLPRMVVGGTSLSLIPWVLLCWRVQTDVDSFSTVRVFVVANPDDVAGLRTDLSLEQEIPAELVGSVSPGEVEVARVGESQPLVDAVIEAKADLLVLDVAGQAQPEIVNQASELHRLGIRIRTMSLFSEEFLGKIPLAEMKQMSLLFDIGEVHRLRYVRFKRVLDVAVAIVALPLLLVSMPVVGVANIVGNPGPLFYSQQRVGKGGRDFRIYKFRSMIPDDSTSNWTETDDPRITRVGAVLRTSHIDELPQIWNVLRGDLSIVGPRPEQRMYVDQLEKKLPHYEVRHLVRPGLTGWAQTKYGYGANDEDAREKLQYDLYYLRRQSLTIDVRIVARTIRTLLLSRGR